MSAFTIDKDAVLDFAFDWSAWLADTETIASHVVTPTDGVTVDSSTEDSGVVTVWLSGATAPRQKVTCHIVTSDGREDDRTITLNVRER